MVHLLYIRKEALPMLLGQPPMHILFGLPSVRPLVYIMIDDATPFRLIHMTYSSTWSCACSYKALLSDYACFIPEIWKLECLPLIPMASPLNRGFVSLL